jgi:hypothetical protein
VEKHGGKIALTNSTDPALHGAAVRVSLPALGPYRQLPVPAALLTAESAKSPG